MSEKRIQFCSPFVILKLCVNVEEGLPFEKRPIQNLMSSYLTLARG